MQAVKWNDKYFVVVHSRNFATIVKSLGSLGECLVPCNENERKTYELMSSDDDQLQFSK